MLTLNNYEVWKILQEIASEKSAFSKMAKERFGISPSFTGTL